MKLPIQLLAAVFVLFLLFSACTKVREAANHAATTTMTSNQDELVPTPFGLLPRSHVHAIENGYAVMRKGGHVYKVERQSRNIIEDYGEIGSASAKSINGAAKSSTGYESPASALNTNVKNKSVPPSNGGWVTFAYWQNTSSGAIGGFQTNWPVPNIPGTPGDNQVLYLFNGMALASGADLIQPVLQFGNNGYFNPNGQWCITNWYLAGSGLDSYTFYNPNFIIVDPGTNLQANITLDGINGSGSYNYTSTFTNPATGTAYDNTLYVIEGEVYNGNTIQTVPELVLEYETLEAYHNTSQGFVNGVEYPSDYPGGQNYVGMDDIVTAVGSSYGIIPSWTVDNNNTPNGESTDLTPPINNSTNKGGEIFIYWHSAPTINSATSVKLTKTSTGYTISAYPGTLVNVVLAGLDLSLGKISGTTTSTLTITTPGVTFTNGNTSVTATNGTGFYSLTMPSTGTLTVNGYYTTTAGIGFLNAYAQLY